MIPFSSRTKGYKTGVFLLFFAAILFVVGFGAPYWFTADFIYDKSHSGLWESCSTKCSTFRTKEIPVWFHAVRAFEALCIIGLTSACIYALITNFCLSVPGPRSRALEITAGVSGILGFIGCMVYVGKTDTLDKHIQDYGWAFYFAAVGSGLVVIAAIVIAVNNKPVEYQQLSST
ncbi:voltage-dependent calcium channel gamma-4 subunit-like [Babylonia areolata]|uniref:voltage-dependent calcium channel gamma-4 subunit-like n=1 Tax=Babylonia areolata TaxID=304850 RepID=UPI003FD283B7